MLTTTNTTPQIITIVVVDSIMSIAESSNNSSVTIVAVVLAATSSSSGSSSSSTRDAHISRPVRLRAVNKEELESAGSASTSALQSSFRMLKLPGRNFPLFSAFNMFDVSHTSQFTGFRGHRAVSETTGFASLWRSSISTWTHKNQCF